MTKLGSLTEPLEFESYRITMSYSGTSWHHVPTLTSLLGCPNGANLSH